MTILNDRFTRPLLAAGENLGFLDDSSGVFMASAAPDDLRLAGTRVLAFDLAVWQVLHDEGVDEVHLISDDLSRWIVSVADADRYGYAFDSGTGGKYAIPTEVFSIS